MTERSDAIASQGRTITDLCEETLKFNSFLTKHVKYFSFSQIIFNLLSYYLILITEHTVK